MCKSYVFAELRPFSVTVRFNLFGEAMSKVFSNQENFAKFVSNLASSGIAFSVETGS